MQAFFPQSQHIACYIPYQDEFDATPLIEAVWAAKKACYVPVVQAEKWLRFVRYDDGAALRKNQYGILEPTRQEQVIPPDELDVVVLPLLAFDRYGHRLGTGGGYYDRTFAFLRGEENPKPSLVGLAYAAQETTEIEADPWDVPLNAIVTEKNVIIIDA
jgi:5-formyltetrahydrofolate cyclo-ligase